MGHVESTPKEYKTYRQNPLSRVRYSYASVSLASGRVNDAGNILFLVQPLIDECRDHSHLWCSLREVLDPFWTRNEIEEEYPLFGDTLGFQHIDSHQCGAALLKSISASLNYVRR